MIPISSKYIGSPKGYYNTIEELIEHDPKNQIFEIKSSQDVNLKKPEFILGSLDKGHLDDTKYNTDDIKLVTLHNARIILNPFSIITSDDKLIASDSQWFGNNPEDHWIFNSIKLPKVYKMKGNYLFLGASDNYYHFIAEFVPLLLLLTQLPLEISKINGFLVHPLDKPFQKDIIKLFPEVYQKIIIIEHEHYEFDTLSYFSGSHWLPDPYKLKMVRNYLLSQANKDIIQYSHIYITRSDTTTRQIENESEIVEALVKNGFKNICLSDFTIFEQAQIFNNAKIIISPHGAGLTNLIFCKAKTKILEIKNEAHHGSFTHGEIYWHISNIFDLSYSTILCPSKIVGNKSSKVDKESLSISPKSLLKMLNQIQ